MKQPLRNWTQPIHCKSEERSNFSSLSSKRKNAFFILKKRNINKLKGKITTYTKTSISILCYSNNKATNCPITIRESNILGVS